VYFFRQAQVAKTHQIVWDAKSYDLYTFPDYKCYQLVYDKRIIDPITFQTYPYGYQQAAQMKKGTPTKTTRVQVHALALYLRYLDRVNFLKWEK